MGLPSDTRQLADIAATTLDTFLPKVIDQVFKSNALMRRMDTKERVLLEGGEKIRQSIIYDKMNSGWYSGLDTFDVSRKETKVPMIFDWRCAWANLSIDGLTMLQNAGAAKVIDLVETEMDTARLTISDLLGTGLFGDGTGTITSAKAINGLLQAVDDSTNYSSYAGITRGSDAVGTAVKGKYDATGGAISISAVNAQMGEATIQPEKTDLIATTQALWNKVYDRVQPQQRYPQGPNFDDVANIGFDTINLNGAAIVVDSHVPSGYLFGLNTSYLKLVVHQQRDFHFTGFKVPINQDAIVGQILWAGNLVCMSPRLQFQMRGLS